MFLSAGQMLTNVQVICQSGPGARTKQVLLREQHSRYLQNTMMYLSSSLTSTRREIESFPRLRLQLVESIMRHLLASPSFNMVSVLSFIASNCVLSLSYSQWLCPLL